MLKLEEKVGGEEIRGRKRMKRIQSESSSSEDGTFETEEETETEGETN